MRAAGDRPMQRILRAHGDRQQQRGQQACCAGIAGAWAHTTKIGCGKGKP
jgi:hypothetical protein